MQPQIPTAKLIFLFKFRIFDCYRGVVNLLQLRGDLIVLVLVAAFSLCGGLLIERFRNTPINVNSKIKEERQPHLAGPVATRRAESGPTFALPDHLSLGEFSAFVDKNQCLILDVRPKAFYRFGHVPGALSLPWVNFKNGYAALKEKLETDRSQPIIIYCFGQTCTDSASTKKALLSLEYTNVAVFDGGWDEWHAAKRPVETSK